MSEFMFFVFGILFGIFICSQSFENIEQPKRKYYVEMPTKNGIDTLYLTE